LRRRWSLMASPAWCATSTVSSGSSKVVTDSSRHRPAVVDSYHIDRSHTRQYESPPSLRALSSSNVTIRCWLPCPTIQRGSRTPCQDPTSTGADALQ
jgi:hypothetical protein